MKRFRGVRWNNSEEVQEQYKNQKQVEDEPQLNLRLDILTKDAMYYAHSRGVVHRDLAREHHDWGLREVTSWISTSIVAEMDGVDQETKITLSLNKRMREKWSLGLRSICHRSRPMVEQ